MKYDYDDDDDDYDDDDNDNDDYDDDDDYDGPRRPARREGIVSHAHATAKKSQQAGCRSTPPSTIHMAPMRVHPAPPCGPASGWTRTTRKYEASESGGNDAEAPCARLLFGLLASILVASLTHLYSCECVCGQGTVWYFSRTFSWSLA